jgi:hypothetical protein
MQRFIGTMILYASFMSCATDESDFNTLAQRIGNATEHCQGMTLVVRIFQAAYDRSSRADFVGQITLRKPRIRPGLVNHLRDFDLLKEALS